MSAPSGGTTSGLDPVEAWAVLTESPLKGLAFAREAGWVLAWDEGDRLSLFDARGETLSTTRSPNRIVAATISDDGSRIAVVCEGDSSGLLILSGDMEILVQRPAPGESSFVATDPFGRYMAVGGRVGPVQLIDRHGRAAGRIETVQAMAHVCFIPDRPFLVGAAAFGMLAGVELTGSRSSGRLGAEILWQDRLMSNVGRLTTTGDGSMVLASCFTHGIQRFDLDGRNEGAYHLGGTVAHAVPDYPGRTIAAATLEGELLVLNSAGNVRWRTTLARPPIALEIDPLGRFLIYGFGTGEITRLDLFGASSARRSAPAGARATTASSARSVAGGAMIRRPDWEVQAVQTEDQAETAVLAVCDDPPAIAVFSSPRRLEIFDADGRKIAQGPDLTGVGRILRTAPGWLAAATDREIALHDLRRGEQERVDLRLVDLTHLAIKPDSFGLAIVQERDRIGRATTAGRWIWKHELPAPIEDLAVGREGFAAATTDHGQLLVFDPAGHIVPTGGFDPADPPLLIEAPEGSPPGVAWVTLSRRDQRLAGHGPKGDVVWTRQLPWEGWSLRRLGGFALVAAADGRVMAFDGAGTARFEGGPDGTINDVFFLGSGETPLRVVKKDVHLLCSALDGRVEWRMVADRPLGPRAAGRIGVAAMIGHNLAWFRNAPKANGST